MADLHASPHSVSADPLAKAVPTSNVIDHAHLIAPPDGDGQAGLEVATLYDAPLVMELVPKGVERYKRKTR